MTPTDLADIFADALAEKHGCRVDYRGLETRKPCAECQGHADVCAGAWIARFRGAA